MGQSHSSQLDAGHGSVGSYAAGFVLSVVLTAASFGVVTWGGLPPHAALIAPAVLAFEQIVVHLVYFLHMNSSSGQRWNVMAFSYTVLTTGILIIGTIWVMHNVSMNMMSR
jgi:cytochrome o ubiquinol oxidase operon protein cyoD